MSDSRLELRGISLDYGRGPVLRGVDLTLAPGELVGLIGPNGAGKSSLLRCITGRVRPATGAVVIDGQPAREFDRGSLARLIAVVPGQVTIAFPLLVEELVALGRVPYERSLLGPSAPDRAAIDAAIERVGIGHLRNRDVRELSLGERQLALIALAVCQQPRLMLLDEPTVHLDLRNRVEVMTLLRDLSERDGMTILAVMHDIALAAHFFPRLVLLQEGRLVADGSPRDVLTPERIGGAYGVDPAVIAFELPVENRP